MSNNIEEPPRGKLPLSKFVPVCVALAFVLVALMVAITSDHHPAEEQISDHRAEGDEKSEIAPTVLPSGQAPGNDKTGHRSPALVVQRDHALSIRATGTSVASGSLGSVDRFQEFSSWISPEFGRDFSNAKSPVFAEFAAWVENFVREENPDRSTIEKGIAIAERRRDAIGKLIEVNPEKAISLAIPLNIREQLPVTVLDASESFVEGTGDYLVEHACGGPLGARIDRTLTLPNQTPYQVAVYGRREAVGSKENLPVHGIAVGNQLAIEESPVRLTESSNSDTRESFDLMMGAEQVANLSGGRISELMAEQIAKEQESGSRGTALSPRRNTVLASPHTTGGKKILVIRVDFSNLSGTPTDVRTGSTITRSFAMDVINNQVAPWFRKASYGKLDYANITSSDITDVLRMSEKSYRYPYLNSIANEAKKLASKAGYKLKRYDNFLIVCPKNNNWDYLGWATINSNKYVALNGSFYQTLIAHELGHNLGLRHASGWMVDPYDSSNPMDSEEGYSDEYEDPFDTMGWSNWGSWWPHENDRFFSPYAMRKLGWMESSSVFTPSRRGTIRLYRFDTQNADPDDKLAIQLKRKKGQEIWIGFRKSFDGTDFDNASEGAYVTVKGFSGGTDLIDFSNDSTGFDQSLDIGQQFTDDESDFSIKTLRKGGSGDRSWLEVDVTFPSPPAVSNTPAPVAVVSGDLVWQLAGSDAPTKFKVKGLPKGLRLDAKTGRITGKPARPGDYEVTVYAYNSIGRSEPRKFTLTVDPLAEGIVGTFHGDVTRNSQTNGSFGGGLQFKLNSSGAFSGKFTLGPSGYKFKGKLNATAGQADQTATFQLKRKGQQDLDITVNLDDSADALSGTIYENGTLRGRFNAGRLVWSKKSNPTPDYAGRYNTVLVLDSDWRGNVNFPQGHGYTMMSVNTAGGVKISGKAPDGAKFSSNSLLHKDGSFHLFKMLNGNYGSLMGYQSIALSGPSPERPDSSTTGNLKWRKKKNDRKPGKNYPNGFGLCDLLARGGKWIRPAKGDIIFGLSDDGATPNTDLVFRDNVTVVTPVRVTSKHKVAIRKEDNPDTIKTSINLKNGSFKGSFKKVIDHPLQAGKNYTRKANFSGVVIPRRGRAYGYYSLGAEPSNSPGVTETWSGRVELD